MSLEGNKLTKMPEITSLEKLKVLSLKGNPIKEVDNMKKCKKYETLKKLKAEAADFCEEFKLICKEVHGIKMQTDDWSLVYWGVKILV